MRTFKFKIENYTNSPHFILIKGENSFKAMNIAKQMFPMDKYKITLNQMRLLKREFFIRKLNLNIMLLLSLMIEIK